MAKPYSASRLKEKITGDLQEKSDQELRSAFPNLIKGLGKDMIPSSTLPFRREKMVIGGLPNTGKDEVV